MGDWKAAATTRPISSWSSERSGRICTSGVWCVRRHRPVGNVGRDRRVPHLQSDSHSGAHMAERLEFEGLDTGTLPVLPLTSGVVLPQMVVTLALETDEAKAAADAAAEADGELLLVPRFPDAGRYGRVGTVATIENKGTLPGGTPALVVRAIRRAHVGAGVIGTTAALWVHAEPIDDVEPSARAVELAGDVRAVIAALFDRLGGRRLSGVVQEGPGP